MTLLPDKDYYLDRELESSDSMPRRGGLIMEAINCLQQRSVTFKGTQAKQGEVIFYRILHVHFPQTTI